MITLTMPRRRKAAAAGQARGEHPYADEAPTEALERLAPDGQPAFAPRPTFTPRPVAETRPLEALAAPPQEAFSDVRQDRDVLTRVLDGLKGLDTGRASSFAADFKGLPLFRQVARSKGWCGMQAAPAGPGHVRWTTERWMRQAMHAIDADVMQARSDADEQLGRAGAEVAMELDGYLRAAAGTRAA